MSMPQISTNNLLRAFMRLGFIETSRANSHIKIIHQQDASRYASLPNHRGQCVAPGTLRNILKSARVDVKQLKQAI